MTHQAIPSTASPRTLPLAGSDTSTPLTFMRIRSAPASSISMSGSPKITNRFSGELQHFAECYTALNYTSRIRENHPNPLCSVQSRIFFYSLLGQSGTRMGPDRSARKKVRLGKLFFKVVLVRPGSPPLLRSFSSLQAFARPSASDSSESPARGRGSEKQHLPAQLWPGAGARPPVRRRAAGFCPPGGAERLLHARQGRCGGGII